MELDDFRNYINRQLKNANDELDYCTLGLHGELEHYEDNPDISTEEWSYSIEYAEQDIDELENTKKILDRFEKSLEVEE